MKTICFLAVLIALLGVAYPQRADATEESGGPEIGVAMLSISNAVLTLVNTAAWVQDGSIATGTIGIVASAFAVGVSVANHEELGTNATVLFASMGVVGAVVGTGALVHGIHVRNRSHSRLSLAPVLGIERRPTFGVQLIARW